MLSHATFEVHCTKRVSSWCNSDWDRNRDSRVGTGKNSSARRLEHKAKKSLYRLALAPNFHKAAAAISGSVNTRALQSPINYEFALVQEIVALQKKRKTTKSPNESNADAYCRLMHPGKPVSAFSHQLRNKSSLNQYSFWWCSTMQKLCMLSSLTVNAQKLIRFTYLVPFVSHKYERQVNSSS